MTLPTREHATSSEPATKGQGILIVETNQSSQNNAASKSQAQTLTTPEVSATAGAIRNLIDFWQLLTSDKIQHTIYLSVRLDYCSSLKTKDKER